MKTRGEDFVDVKLKPGVGSLRISDGRLQIALEGPGPHRVTRGEWTASRELQQYAEEVSPPAAAGRMKPEAKEKS